MWRLTAWAWEADSLGSVSVGGPEGSQHLVISFAQRCKKNLREDQTRQEKIRLVVG